MDVELKTRNLRSALEQVQAAFPVSCHLEIPLGVCTVRVESNSQALLDRLGPYFHAYLRPSAGPTLRITALEAPEPDLGQDFLAWPRDPGKVGGKDSYADLGALRVIRKVRTGMQFVLHGDHALAVGRCMANSNQIVNLVNARYMTAFLDQGFVLCHAAGIERDGKGLAMSGVSGAGKSTLALHMMERGANYVSNDRLLVRGELGEPVMLGVPKLPRINPGTILNQARLWPLLSDERRAQLQALPQAELWALEEKYDVDVAGIFGPDRVRIRAPVVGYVVLTWRPTSSDPMRAREGRLGDRPELLDAIVKHPGPFHFQPGVAAPARPLPEYEPYLAQLGQTPYLELSGGVDFARACDLCLERLA